MIHDGFEGDMYQYAVVHIVFDNNLQISRR